MSGFAAVPVTGRADILRASCASRGLDGFIATDPISVRWLTGFTGSAGTAVIARDDIALITDARYTERAEQELAGAGSTARVITESGVGDQYRAVAAVLDSRWAVGAEAATLSHQRWTELAEHANITSADALLRDLRRVKHPTELARIRCAADIASQALSHVAPKLGVGHTERDIARMLNEYMVALGADGPGYSTIVASGPHHAARPHHEPRDRVIELGDWVVIDVGAEVDGYRSDMTRSFVVGEPTTEQHAMYDILLGAQRAGVASVKAGAAARSVDAICRSACSEAGYADWYLHSTGHGVGLQIHEEPFLSPRATTDLREGEVVTVEPGLYRVGVGGLRIEDLVVVTEQGCQVLTNMPKDSPCLPSPPTT